MAANYIISKIAGLNLKDYGCTLKAYKKDIINNIPLYGEMHRFIPLMRLRAGVKSERQKSILGPAKTGKAITAFPYI